MLKSGWICAYAVGMFVGLIAIGPGQAALGQAAKSRAACEPISQRTQQVGCWIIAEQPLGLLPQVPLFWHMSTYPNRAAAEAAQGPGSTVLEALGKTWLFTIAESGHRDAQGTFVAKIGPLPVSSSVNYTAQYMEAIFPPGAQTAPHTHPGPEIWYHEAGGVCLETPQGKGEGRAGDGGYVVPGGVPMRLTVVGTEQRRSIVLILGETGQPWTNLGKETWVPKGLCL